LIGNKELCLLKKNNFHFESKQRYGSPRMTVELILGSKVSRITVAKYMNQLGLRSKLSKIQGYDHSKHNHLIMPNVLNREFSVTEPSKGFDITYIRVKEGFLYLTTVLDPMIEKS
jgi:hypothetical protein